MALSIHKLARSFLLKSLILFFLWMVLYYGYIQPDGTVNSFLTQAVLKATVSVLNGIGFSSNYVDNIVYVDGQKSVIIADVCNGLELMVLYAAFFICFPGPVKHKIIFVPLGTILIFFINVIREVLLVLNYNYFQRTFEFNHKYTYVFFVYAAVFLIWRFWLNNYSIVGKRVANKE